VGAGLLTPLSGRVNVQYDRIITVLNVEMRRRDVTPEYGEINVYRRTEDAGALERAP